MQLSTQRTYLHLLSISDFQEVLEMFMEPDMFKYIAPSQNRNEEQHIEFLYLKLKQIQEGKGYYYLARSKDNNEFIGGLNLTPIGDTDKVQIGWLIKSKFRRQGFAFETARALLDFAIQNKTFNPIYAVYETANIASKKIIEKLNFQFLETTVEDGIEINTYVFDIDTNIDLT